MQAIEHIILNRKLMKVWHVGVHWLNGKKTKSPFLVSRTKKVTIGKYVLEMV